MTKQYPTASIKININPVHVFKTQGYLINEWLVTGFENSLYKAIQVFNCFGYPVTNLKFSDWEDVNKFAEFLNKHYKDYWILWYENPQADVPGLTRYTIDDGIALYDAFSKLENKIVSFEEIDECIRFSS